MISYSFNPNSPFPNAASHGLNRPRLLDAASGRRRDGRDEKRRQCSIGRMKRLLAVVAGGLGLGALLRRRSRRTRRPRRRTTCARSSPSRRRRTRSRPRLPPAPQTVEDRRADVHAQARRGDRRAKDELDASSSRRSASVRRAQRPAHVLTQRHAARGDDRLERRVAREALDDCAQLAGRGRVAAPHRVDDHLGERRGEPGDRAGGAGRRAPRRSAPRRRRRRRARRACTARPLRTASRSPSSRRGCRPSRAAARRRRPGSRSRTPPRARRRRTASGAHARAAAVKWASSASSSSRKYGGAITATASAPGSAACAASAAVSRRRLRAAVREHRQRAADSI